MDVIGTVSGMHAFADAQRAAGRRIALVPTMGALHAGHLALVAEAERRAGTVVVSIFVNPAQFDERADLERYPRPLESDLEKCRKAGVAAVFVPEAAELYPPGCQTWVEVGELTGPMEGRARPGHFRGVTTVVAKLLAAVKPHVALFGEKDFQQLAAVRRMARDLCLDVEIAGHPTVREADGLALSSRNELLDGEARRQATALVRALDAAERAVAAGERDTGRLLRGVEEEIAKAPLARVDYAELRDPDTLEPAPAELSGPALLALAVRFPAAGARGARSGGGPPSGGEAVRLIDNRVLRPRPPAAWEET